MKLLPYLALATSAATAAAAIALDQPNGGAPQNPLGDMLEEDKFLVESQPGKTHWVSEDEKWALKRAGVNFIDITSEQVAGPQAAALHTRLEPVTYPDSMQHADKIRPLATQLSKQEMRDHLTLLTSFHTRYYKSADGVKSATWLYDQVLSTLDSAGAREYGATVEKVLHPWGQFSIVARIPGATNETVVIGAHQDSINLFMPSLLAAPGADDDGSGTVTILEALRVLVQDEEVRRGRARNTVEFHWYSAEEGGLLGSQAVFQEYKRQGRVVKAMLQQDMTGYVQGTLDAGLPESVGVITDYVDAGLTEFIKKVVTEYCDIPYVLTKCGYACSDHASASRYGYPSAFVIESAFEFSDKRIHTIGDTIEYLSFDHMLQHAKMTLGLAYELAFAEL